MSESLKSIPPLIPLPPSSNRPNHHTRQKTEEDLFASLLSSSSNEEASKSIFVPVSRPPPEPAPALSATPSSVASEFGAFVSVPRSLDPLGGEESKESDEDGDWDFLEEAKERSEQNAKRVREELRTESRDPLHWLKPEADTAAESSPSGPAIDPIAFSERPSLPDFEPPVEIVHVPGQKDIIDLSSSTPKPPDAAASSRMPATPPPRMTRSGSSTLSRSWFSTLVRSSSLPSPAQESREEVLSTSPSSSGIFDAHQSLQDQMTSAHPTMHQHGVPPITHPHNPFATPTPFVPPSGAPLFTGEDREWNKSGFDFDFDNNDHGTVNGSEPRRSVELRDRKLSTSSVLTTEIANMIRLQLPALFRLPSAWSLLYSLDQHGVSLSTLFSKCAAQLRGVLLVIQDAENTIFGVWLPDGLRVSHGSYYGSGDSFLWRYRSDDGMNIFRWTGKNDYVALCEPDSLSFGGGDGHYGLYIDSALSEGSSARCPTFENDVLCSETGTRRGKTALFDCVGIECWGVGSM